MSQVERTFARFPCKDGKPGLDLCKIDPEAFAIFLREVQARIRKIRSDCV